MREVASCCKVSAVPILVARKGMAFTSWGIKDGMSPSFSRFFSYVAYLSLFITYHPRRSYILLTPIGPITPFLHYSTT